MIIIIFSLFLSIYFKSSFVFSLFVILNFENFLILGVEYVFTSHPFDWSYLHGNANKCARLRGNSA